MVCPNCGTPIGENAKFCSNCGFNLVEGVPANDGWQQKAGRRPMDPHEVLLKRAKIYKYSLRALFCVFAVLSLILYVLPVSVYDGRSVYIYAGSAGYSDGLNGMLQTTYFALQLILNMFTDFDWITTPCAIAVVLSIIGVIIAVVFAVVRVFKNIKVNLNLEAFILAYLALYMLISVLLMCGVGCYYKEPVGAASITLLVISSVFFTAALIFFLLRRKFFERNPQIACEVEISGYIFEQ